MNKTSNKSPRYQRFGFGCWPLAAKGWKAVNQQEAALTLKYALQKGITFFDTAPVYGFGISEQLLGTSIKESGLRSTLTIATKCGLTFDKGRISHNLSYNSILTQCDESLKRLQTDVIDLYQIHWPDNKTPLQETMRALNRLKDEKLIKKIAVCNFSPTEITEVLKYSELYSSQNLYNYLQRDAESELLPFCSQHNIEFHAYSPLAQGLLTTTINADYSFAKQDIRKLNPLFDIQDKRDIKKGLKDKKRTGSSFANALRKRAELGKNPLYGSLQFLLKNKNVSRIIIGTTKKEHLDELLLSFVE